MKNIEKLRKLLEENRTKDIVLEIYEKALESYKKVPGNKLNGLIHNLEYLIHTRLK